MDSVECGAGFGVSAGDNDKEILGWEICGRSSKRGSCNNQRQIDREPGIHIPNRK